MFRKCIVGALLFVCANIALADTPYNWTVSAGANHPPITINPASQANCSNSEDICWA